MESTRGVCVLQVSPLIAFPTTLPCRAYELRNYSRFLLLRFHRINLTQNLKEKKIRFMLLGREENLAFMPLVHAASKCKNEQVCLKFHWIHADLQPQSMNLF